MNQNKSTVYYAKNMQDVLFQLKTVQELEILGGCTETVQLPKSSLILSSVPEFKAITNHERYIDFGAAVTISQILELESKRLSSVFVDAAKTIGTPFVRNIATLGGNLCSKGIKKTLYASLLALDAMIEIHSVNESALVPITKFVEVPEKCFVSKIRIPTQQWEIAIYRRLGPSFQINDDSASFVFLANIQKDVLVDIRLAFAGSIVLRNREWENNLIGTKLPLSEKMLQSMLESANEYMVSQVDLYNAILNPILKDQYLNLVKYSLLQLC